MDLRPPPTRSGDPAHHVSIIALLAMQLSTLLGLGTLLWLAWPGHRPSAYPSAARQREVASKLKAAGALDEAANLYEQHLATTADLENGREQLAFSLGTLYLEGGQYERALRWFYEAEAVGGQLEQEIAEKIVHTLERLGRVHAAHSALAARTQLAPATVQRPADDPVVASIGSHQIHASDVQRALDDLPPELAKHFAPADQRETLLRKVVADHLLWEKAKKLEYDRDPEVRRRLESWLRQLAIGTFVEREILGKIEAHEADLQSYFTANRSRYQEKTFAEAKGAVERDYRAMKSQAAYQDLISQELQAADVKLFPDKLPKDR